MVVSIKISVAETAKYYIREYLYVELRVQAACRFFAAARYVIGWSVNSLLNGGQSVGQIERR